MHIPLKIARQNELLARELGNPPYAWVWSEDLLYLIQKTNANGDPEYNWRCACGLNKTVHDPKCESLVIPEPIYEATKVFSHLNQQWVMCRRIPHAFSEYHWRQAFGSRLPFEKTTWAPCDPVWLDPGEEPFEETTWAFIHAIRKQFEKTGKDVAREGAEAIERAERARKESLRDEIRDSAPAFCGTPGEKGHWSIGGIKNTPLVAGK